MKPIDSILVAASALWIGFDSKGYRDAALFVLIGIIMLGIWRLYDGLRQAARRAGQGNLPCRYDADYSLCGGGRFGGGKSEKSDGGPQFDL
jgi:hypothetical protein